MNEYQSVLIDLTATYHSNDSSSETLLFNMDLIQKNYNSELLCITMNPETWNDVASNTNPKYMTLTSNYAILFNDVQLGIEDNLPKNKVRIYCQEKSEIENWG